MEEQEQVQTESEVTEDREEDHGEGELHDRGGSTESEGNGLVVVTDIERTEETIFNTNSGKIHLVHEITLGDAITSILLAAVIIFMFLDRVIRR